jgi:hypothetical protein
MKLMFGCGDLWNLLWRQHVIGFDLTTLGNEMKYNCPPFFSNTDYLSVDALFAYESNPEFRSRKTWKYDTLSWFLTSLLKCSMIKESLLSFGAIFPTIDFMITLESPMLNFHYARLKHEV